MTLPELLTVMAILSVVMTGILTVFVGGLHATTDMNERFQAQQNARLALATMRTDIGSACSATVSSVAGQAAGSLVALVEPNTSTPSTGCSSGTSQVSWCADSASHALPFTLYRLTGAGACAYNNGTSRVGLLRSNVVFSCTTAAAARPQVGVTLPVDANLKSTAGTYTLTDKITPRNTSVAASC
jgi:prepilin-type N-terminal cleavage/methylation domain-containing protein